MRTEREASFVNPIVHVRFHLDGRVTQPYSIHGNALDPTPTRCTSKQAKCREYVDFLKFTFVPANCTSHEVSVLVQRMNLLSGCRIYFTSEDDPSRSTHKLLISKLCAHNNYSISNWIDFVAVLQHLWAINTIFLLLLRCWHHTWTASIFGPLVFRN